MPSQADDAVEASAPGLADAPGPSDAPGLADATGLADAPGPSDAPGPAGSGGAGTVPLVLANPLVAGPLPGEAAARRPGLIAELKRREIFHGVAAYLIIAFGLLHALDVIIPALALPASLMPGFIGAAIVGLPFAITLGWLFDLREDGVHRDEGADHVGFLDPPTRWPRVLLVAGVAIALAIVSLGAWLRFFTAK